MSFSKELILRSVAGLSRWCSRQVAVPFVRRARCRLLGCAERMPACSWHRLGMLGATAVFGICANRALSPMAAHWFPDPAAKASAGMPKRNRALDYPWLPLRRADQFESLHDRIPCPPGFERVIVAPDSFSEWLRYLPVAPRSATLAPTDGSVGQDAAFMAPTAAIELISLGRNGSGANLFVRLRAEYGWWAQDETALSFHYASGLRSDWHAWAQGQRPLRCGEGLRFEQVDRRDGSRESFREFLGALMRHSAGIGILDDTRAVSDGTIAAGDVWLDSKGRGAALMILDVATNARGEVRILLGESTRQNAGLHVLQSVDSAAAAGGQVGSPWISITIDSRIELGQGETYHVADLRRWAS